jgi:hypothetical protein
MNLEDIKQCPTCHRGNVDSITLVKKIVKQKRL